MNKVLVRDDRYERMIEAIADCHSVDGCKDVANRAEALSVYAAQARDERSLTQYLEIKIRAWRRIGELLCELSGLTPKSIISYGGVVKGPAVPKAAMEKMRTSFTCDLTDLEIRRAIAVASIEGDFFEAQAKNKPKGPYYIFQSYVSFLSEEWLRSPEGKEYSQDVLKEKAERRQALESIAEGAVYQGKLTPNIDTVTIDVVLNKKFHDVWRRVAFERRQTQQHLIRMAMVEWLIKEDYDVPDDPDEGVDQP